MRALITGASGFVGKYLVEELINNGYSVYLGTRMSPNAQLENENQVYLNYADVNGTTKIIEDINPDVIFHLSGQGNVKKSWSHIQETFQSNVMDAIGLFDAVRFSALKDKVKVISVGSSEEYGPVKEMPIQEISNTNPTNPYGVSKLSVCRTALHYHQYYGLNIIHTRAFNHIGPGQSLGFVTSDFAKQVADIENNLHEPYIYVGDLSSKRDFTDVRDVVRAYRLLAEKGTVGEVYNVCSGTSVSIRTVLDYLISFSNKKIEVIIDEKKFRPNDIPEYFGSYNKIEQIVGWKPCISLKDSLGSIFYYWKNK